MSAQSKNKGECRTRKGDLITMGKYLSLLADSVGERSGRKIYSKIISTIFLLRIVEMLLSPNVSIK